jgi:hypothetical protein
MTQTQEAAYKGARLAGNLKGILGLWDLVKAAGWNKLKERLETAVAEYENTNPQQKER